MQNPHCRMHTSSNSFQLNCEWPGQEQTDNSNCFVHASCNRKRLWTFPASMKVWLTVKYQS